MAKAAALRKPKKKVNPLDKDGITYIDYKDTALLRKFISDRGKIRARRVTGVTSQQQRQIARAVKNAREMALLPYTATAAEGRHRHEDHPDSGGVGPRHPRRHRRGQGRLRPQLPAAAGVRDRLDQGRREAGHGRSSGPASAREIRDLGHANEVKAQLEGLKVTLSARAGTGGRLFGSVTPAEVVEAVKAAGGPELDRRRSSCRATSSRPGSTQVQVQLHPEVTATFGVSVIPSK